MSQTGYEGYRDRCGGCMYDAGEGKCCMTGERYQELYDNEALGNLPCQGRGIGPGTAGLAGGTGEGAAGEVMEAPKFAGYQQYKAEMDRELTRAAEGFVRIGYLLRVAEDTDILEGSGYRNVAEFAAAEYGLDKTQVSRFMNINIRFSEGGYSGRLQERYRRFGYAKLAVMLSLPDAVNEELPDSLSKAEVQAVAEEVRAEAAISDIELAIERAAVPEGGQGQPLLRQAAGQLCREQPGLYQKLWRAQASLEDMQEALIPLGEAVFLVRIPGMGRLMVTVREQEASITVVRTGEKERHSTGELVAELRDICREGMTPEGAFPEGDPPGQPAQPEAAAGGKGQKQRRATRVTKARPAAVGEAPGAGAGQPAAGAEGQGSPAGEGELPGQMDVYDYPEVIPGGMEGGIPEDGETGKEGEASGGDAAAADAREGACPGDGEERAGRGPDGLSGHHEGPGAAEDDGCEEDPGAAGMNGEPEWGDDWTGVLYGLEDVKRRVASCNRWFPDVSIPRMEGLYQASISLAAAIEGILMRRRADEQEHLA